MSDDSGETDELAEAERSLELASHSLGDASRELLLVAVFLGELGNDAYVLSEAADTEVAAARRVEVAPRAVVAQAVEMPTSVSAVFAAAGLEPAGVVRWGEPVPCKEPGVYVVSLREDPEGLEGLRLPPIDPARVAELLDVRPELRLRAQRPSAEELAFYLEFFWLPDETVLYVGMSRATVRKRVGSYYRTPLGARAPHAGGWFLKTLSVLDELWVHYAPAEDPVVAERLMLQAFSHGVSGGTRVQLMYEGQRSAPFANLRSHTGRNKNHGLHNATEPVQRGHSATKAP